ADDVDLIVDDHLLDDAAGIVGNAAVVAHGQFDLAPGHRVAVLLHVELDRGLELTADRGEAGTCHRHAHADFQNRIGGDSGASNEAAGGGGGHAHEHCSTQHDVPPLFQFSLPL